MNGRQMNNFFLFTKSNTLLTQHSLSISLTTPNLRMTKFSTQTTRSTQNQAKIYQFDPISSDMKKNRFSDFIETFKPKTKQNKRSLKQRKRVLGGKMRGGNFENFTLRKVS